MESVISYGVKRDFCLIAFGALIGMALAFFTVENVFATKPQLTQEQRKLAEICVSPLTPGIKSECEANGFY